MEWQAGQGRRIGIWSWDVVRLSQAQLGESVQQGAPFIPIDLVPKKVAQARRDMDWSGPATVSGIGSVPESMMTSNFGGYWSEVVSSRYVMM